MAQPPERLAYKVHEVAAGLNMSPKWVRENWKKLGGVKIRGTYFFKPDPLDHALTPEKIETQDLEGQCQGQGEAPPEELQDQKGSRRLGAGHKGRNEKSPKVPNRHGLLGDV